MIENEALNWKTRAIAYEMALSNIKVDFGPGRMGLLGDQATILNRINEANDYIAIWWRKE